MPSLLPLLLSLSLPLALALPAPQIDPQVPTTGTIAIYKTTSSAAELELGAKLGCLDASGRLSSATTACAKYSLKEGGAYNAATEKGECGFHDSSEPRNEMAGVQDWFAWRCKAGLGNVGVGDAVGVISPPQVDSPTNYFFTTAHEGINYGLYAKEEPRDGKSVDVFTRGPKLGEGSVDLLAVWET